MRTRILIAPMVLVASLALVSGPVSADDGDPATPTECPSPGDIVADSLAEAAVAAQDAAVRLADVETCQDDESHLADAATALQAALDRLSADARGNGVAASVLAALIDGQSLEGADLGAAVSQAARDRRPDQANGEGTGNADDASDVRATPAIPATPEAPATPAVPPTPATPESPPVAAPPVEAPPVAEPPVGAPPVDTPAGPPAGLPTRP